MMTHIPMVAFSPNFKHLSTTFLINDDTHSNWGPSPKIWLLLSAMQGPSLHKELEDISEKRRKYTFISGF